MIDEKIENLEKQIAHIEGQVKVLVLMNVAILALIFSHFAFPSVIGSVFP
jgi:hypothetical protein